MVMTDPLVAAAIITGLFGVATALVAKDRRSKRIEAQLNPNGGSSLADSIHRIETKVDILTGRFEQHLNDSRKVGQ